MHPADVLRSIGGAQSQEPRAGRLQLRARNQRITAADVEHARTGERSIVRTWVMRMTVHLIPAEDYGWLTPLFAERIAGYSRRRLDVLGVPAAQLDRAMEAVAARSGFEVTVQTRTHLAMLLVVEGHACIGPDAGRETVLVATREWLGEPRRRERDESLAELARRYLTAFAPATERDLSFWSGLPLRECRVGLQRIAGELDALRGPGGGTLLVPRGYRARVPRSPVVRLLSAYDTYLMGYASRDHAADPAGQKRILPGGGVLRPTICVDGRLVGLWSSRRSGKRLTIAVEPFAPLSGEVMEAISAEASDIGRFEGLEAKLA